MASPSLSPSFPPHRHHEPPPPRSHSPRQRRQNTHRDRSPPRRRRSYSRSPPSRYPNPNRSPSHSRSPPRRKHYDSRSPPRRDPHRTRSRTPPPNDSHRTRSRSRSPQRRSHSDRPRKTGGFKWKDQTSHTDDRNGERENRGLERGYRDDRRRRSRSRDRNDTSSSKFGRPDLDAKFGGGSTAAPTGKADIDAKFGKPLPADGADGTTKEKREKKDKKEKREKKLQPAAEPMIIVHVNDRLGTKTSVPCLGSDPIKLFKAQVAARIGREPHEIMLKRQGERPFKDQLTLDDYGVSNGVQLDLEVDTGD